MTQLFVDTLANEAGTGPTELTGQSASKAWVYADSSATINNSFNVSSSTDNGSGDYSYGLTNSLNSNSYPEVNESRDSNGNRIAARSGTSATKLLPIVLGDVGVLADGDHSSVAFGTLA
jgi:hypothetical protein